MKFSDVLEQVISQLKHEKRLSYRFLETSFDLSDDDLKELKAELIQARKLAVDDNDGFLVWYPSPTVSTSMIDTTSQVVWAERRQLTVLVCDMLGTVERPGALAPEQRPDHYRRYHDACLEVIRRLDGYVAPQLDHALRVYFGYPQAREDDAKRAVQAALEMRDAVRQLNDHSPQAQPPLWMAIRLSLHTDLALVGASEWPAQNLEITGELVKVARQLCDYTPQNTVVISAETHRLIQDEFVCHDLGLQPLPGHAKPAQLYSVLYQRETHRALASVSSIGINTMVGRRDEIQCLQDCWAQVGQGTGRVVLLRGEAGIGKSRLVRAFKEAAVQAPSVLFECRCSQQQQHSAFYPVINLFKQVLRLDQDHVLSTPWHELEHTLNRYGLPSHVSHTLLANMLSLQPPHAIVPTLALSPQRERQQFFEIMQTLLTGLASKHAMVLIVEDLHWVDASTLELLDWLVTQGLPAHLMIVLTCRPEFDIPWTPHTFLTQLVLKRLSPSEIERLVRQVTGGKALPDEVLRHLISKTDGVPLFVEELTKMILEAGFLREHDDHYTLMSLLPAQTIPSTLQGSLMARLDQLAPGKAVAQLGATIGRTFSRALIQHISPFCDADLERGLQQLVQAEILYQSGSAPSTEFTFKHVLLQDIAYQSLLRPARQRYHENTAHVLQEQFPDVVNTQPELIAHHLSEAGLSAPSLPYWQRAAQRAIKRSAHVETISHLIQGLALLATLPDTPARTQSELSFQLMLGNTLVKLKGYGTPEVGQAYARARELAQRLDDPRQLSRVLYGLWVFYLTRAEFQTALELAAELLTLATAQDDADCRLRSHNAMGSTLCFLGEFTQAHDHLTQGMACEMPRISRTSSPTDAVVPQVANFAYASWTLWYLGFPDQALAASRESQRLAEERQHPFASAVALFYAAILHQLRREPNEAYEQADAVIMLASELEFVMWVAGGTLVRGWALMQQGQLDEGFEQIQQGLTAWHTTGAKLVRPSGLGKLAQAYEMRGEAENGLRTLEEALDVIHQTGMRYYEAELYRQKGRLLWMAGAHDPQRMELAEACCCRAMAIADQQQAKSLQLRAATQLSQFWCQQGKYEPAQRLLRPIYTWFSEGFETADLLEAKALLESLPSR